MSAEAILRRDWPLTVLVGVAALALFVALAWAVSGSTAIAAWDREALAWIHGHTAAPARRALALVSDWHRPRAIVAACLLALALLLWRRERAQALWLLCAVGGGAALNDWVKHSLRRPRPGDEGVWVAATDFSFPSGHVANATLLYGALALLIVCRLRSRGAQAALWAAAALAVALVAASRLVLGAHYPSDVAAAAALAVGWLALCLSVLRAWQRRAGDG